MFSEGYIVNAFSVSFPVILVKNIYKFGSTRKRQIRSEISDEYNRNIELLGVCRIPGFDRNWSIKIYQVHLSMNARKLIALMRNNRHTSDVIRGIFPSNILPYLVSKYPLAYICNTDLSFLSLSSVLDAQSNTNWILRQFRESSGLLRFCFQVFLQKIGKQCLFNNVLIQHRDSDSCGYNVLFYIWMKCYNYSMLQIINIYHTNVLIPMLM